MANRSIGTCRSCNGSVRWCRTEKGANMPVDIDSRPGGNIDLVKIGVGDRYMAKVVKPDPDLHRYVSHFTTCPNADQHRKRK